MPAPQTWGHDQLAADLGAHLRADGQHYTWFNIAMEGYSGARPDVFTMKPFSYHNPHFLSWEVKVDASDFRADITAGKWQKYLAFSQGVTFAVPHGLIKPDDVPKGCGLIVRGANNWRHHRKPTLEQPNFPLPLLVKLLSARPHRGSLESYRYSSRYDEEQRLRKDSHDRVLQEARRKIGKQLGEEIASYLADPEHARKIVDRAREEAEKIRKDALQDRAAIAREWAGLAKLAGLPEGTTSEWTITNALRRLAAALTDTEESKKTVKALKGAKKAIDEALLAVGFAEGAEKLQDAEAM